MRSMPEQGQRIPSVHFIAKDGTSLASEELEGQKTVPYFYPKDDTPGCTKHLPARCRRTSRRGLLGGLPQTLADEILKGAQAL